MGEAADHPLQLAVAQRVGVDRDAALGPAERELQEELNVRAELELLATRMVQQNEPQFAWYHTFTPVKPQ